jgi:hypothetical protein
MVGQAFREWAAVVVAALGTRGGGERENEVGCGLRGWVWGCECTTVQLKAVITFFFFHLKITRRFAVNCGLVVNGTSVRWKRDTEKSVKILTDQAKRKHQIR